MHSRKMGTNKIGIMIAKKSHESQRKWGKYKLESKKNEGRISNKDGSRKTGGRYRWICLTD